MDIHLETLATRQRRVDIAVLAVAVLLPTVVTWIYFVLLHGTHPLLQQAAYAVVKGAQFALPVAAIGWLRRRELWNLRLLPIGIGRGGLFGLLVGLLIFLVYDWSIRGTSLEERLREMILDKIQGMGLASRFKFMLLGCFYAIIHSGLEEYYWRWFTYRWAKRLMYPLPANLVSSLGFMLHHILLLGFFLGFDRWQTWVFSLAIAVGGFCWAWLYQKTGNVIAIWFSHALVDAAIFTLGYAIIFSS